MKDKITVIITIRNRDAERIENQVESVRRNGAAPSFHVVDYGSDAEYSASYKVVCEKLHLQYTHLYAEGLPWNKCRAINYGVEKAETPFIVTSDVDMIYEGNPFQWCLDNYEEKSMYHIETYWLPKSGNKDKASYAGHSNAGGFQFIAKNAFAESGGYDERIEYWGPEDVDWPSRLKLLGYKQIWLPEDFKLFHTWHPKAWGNIYRPNVAEYNTGIYSFQNLMNPVISNNKVKLDEITDRPILEKIKSSKPTELHFDAKKDFEYPHLAILSETIRSSKFIKISLSARLFPHLFKKSRLFFQRVFNKFSKITGSVCIPNYNMNFDLLFYQIPTMKKNGLIDYYFANDLSYAYLLFE